MYEFFDKTLWLFRNLILKDFKIFQKTHEIIALYLYLF